jgi:hypothetical protein
MTNRSEIYHEIRRRIIIFTSKRAITTVFFFLPAHSGPKPLIQFRNHFSQTVGLLGRVISLSQGRYLNTGPHKHRINAHAHARTHTHTHTHTKHLCPEWDSKPGSQRPSERKQFMP